MIIPLQNYAEYPRLVFVHDVHERDIAPHGYRGDVVVEFATGEIFPVYFYEPDAVREELASNVKWGFARFLAEPGLIIIPEISVANMKSSVSALIETGYFTHLRPGCVKVGT
ncbi:MAG: hypothetical protein K2R98_20450 [Gemmataceae bacterium]|nr:hypothetical protein [Gemmataceae bacterium]